jgi:hypothetical protein
MKSGSLNLLEISGPVQAYTGIALPLPSTEGYLDILASQFAYLLIHMNMAEESCEWF